MKQRFLNVVKWFLITLGIIFLGQITFLIALIIIANTTFKMDFKEPKFENFNAKDIQAIVDKAQKYKDENGKYPEKIEDIKLKKNLEYVYSTSKDNECFTVELKNSKDNSKKYYERCDIKKEGLNNFSESFFEER